MNEPKLIDIIAMLAMHAILRDRPRMDYTRAAEDAYDMAEEMIKEGQRRNDGRSNQN